MCKSNKDELIDRVLNQLKRLYYLLINNFKNKSDKDKKNENANYDNAVKNLKQWTTIDAALRKLLSKPNNKKLSFCFHKLFVLTDGIGLDSVSDNESLYLSQKKQFGLSTIILLLGKYYNLKLFFLGIQQNR